MAIRSRYSAYRTMTAHEASTAWRARFKSMRQKFESGQAEASSALASAITDQGVASGDLVARVASARIQREAKAKAEAEKKLPVSEKIDTSRADIKESMFSSDSTGTLASGTKIDLGKGQITLSNGKTIDMKTGVQVYDFSV
jgi:hypothetical protein